MQLCFILWSNQTTYTFDNNTAELNRYLSAGWKVVSVTPMGGNPTDLGFRSVVILEKRNEIKE